MCKAVIFDMDGLMIDSERVTFKWYKEYMRQCGMDMPEEFYKTLQGQTKAECKQKLIKTYGNDFPYEESVDWVHKKMQEEFENDGIPIKEGLVELLKFLKEKKYKTVVATSSERKRVEFILEKAGIRQYFNDIICGDEVEKGKPNPEIFLRACEKVNVNPENALVLEDSEAGIEAANVGNINVICVPDMKFPDEKYQKMSKEICKNLLEAKIYIEQYCG